MQQRSCEQAVMDEAESSVSAHVHAHRAASRTAILKCPCLPRCFASHHHLPSSRHCRLTASIRLHLTVRILAVALLAAVLTRARHAYSPPEAGLASSPSSSSSSPSSSPSTRQDQPQLSSSTVRAHRRPLVSPRAEASGADSHADTSRLAATGSRAQLALLHFV